MWKIPTKQRQQRQQRQPCFTVFTVRPITANSRTSIFNQTCWFQNIKHAVKPPSATQKTPRFFLTEGPVGKNQGWFFHFLCLNPAAKTMLLNPAAKTMLLKQRMRKKGRARPAIPFRFFTCTSHVSSKPACSTHWIGCWELKKTKKKKDNLTLKHVKEKLLEGVPLRRPKSAQRWDLFLAFLVLSSFFFRAFHFFCNLF